MKKLLYVLVQFLIIAYLAGTVCVRLLPVDISIVEYQILFRNWMVINMLLGILWVLGSYVISPLINNNETVNKSMPSQGRNYIRITILHLAMFLLSGVCTFAYFISNKSGQDINIGQAWRLFEPLLLGWLFCAFVLSVIRLIVILLLPSRFKILLT